MKRLSVLGLALSMSSFCFAQDRVITKDGDVFDAYRIDIGSTFVYYTKEDKDNAALQKIAKADVLMIKKKDGTKIDVTEYVPQTSTSQRVQVVPAEKIQGVSIFQRTTTEKQAIKDANTNMIKARNAFNIEFDKSKANNKTANLCVLGYGLKEESVLHNGDLTIFHTFPMYSYAGKGKMAPPHVDLGMQLNIVNNTEKTVYIDLANSFIVRGLDSEAMYVPTATTNSRTSSNGVGVNLGAVTDALGVNGAVGTFAQGVNVGKGNSSTSTTTVYAQRIVAIPPKATKVLTVDRLGKQEHTPTNWFTAEKFTYSNQYKNTNLLHFKFERKFNYGEVYEFEENYPFLNFAVHIGYSLEESCEHLQSMKMLFYPKYIIGTGNGSKWTGYNWNRRIALSIKDANALSFFVVNDAD